MRIRYQAGRVVAVLDGAGSAQTRPFAIPGPGTWGLAWSFGCARTGHPGMFTVGESGTPAARAVALDAAGWSARGTAWMTGDAGRHVLVVISDCVWTIRILRPGGPR